MSYVLLRERDPGDSDPRLPRRLVAVLEGVTDREVVEQVDRIVQGGVVHVMVVTSEPAPVLWGELLESDGVEVVTSATSVAELAAMVTHFAEGGSSMDADGRSALLDAWRLADGRRQRLAALLATLSPQQRRVLDLLASGRRVDEVGEVIGVARGTVRSHVKAMRAKLGAGPAGGRGDAQRVQRGQRRAGRPAAPTTRRSVLPRKGDEDRSAATVASWGRPGRRRGAAGAGQRLSPASGRCAGRSKVNVVPTPPEPMLLRMVPPCRSTTSWQMASPMPVPTAEPA